MPPRFSTLYARPAENTQFDGVSTAVAVVAIAELDDSDDATCGIDADATGDIRATSPAIACHTAAGYGCPSRNVGATYVTECPQGSSSLSRRAPAGSGRSSGSCSRSCRSLNGASAPAGLCWSSLAPTPPRAC